MNSRFPAGAQPVKLYGFPLSGHSHRVNLLLSLLDVPHEVITVDLPNGAHKSPDFLKLNSFGVVPVIDDNGYILSESTAILVYLAKKYDPSGKWLPEDAGKAGEVHRWLAVASGALAAGPGAARLVKVFNAPLDHAAATKKAHDLLTVLEEILSSRSYLAGDEITIADIAGYSYVAHAPEGGVFLDDYPAVRKWLSRIEAQDRFIGMPKSAIPEAA
ncbi:glutathione S-transferase family protein [Roseibium sp.]|uniref:glutathione S-transferase family protein n=1 Tax=Roseibium sp. TaxID=1936156 RepID=UPI003A969E11